MTMISQDREEQVYQWVEDRISQWRETLPYEADVPLEDLDSLDNAIQTRTMLTKPQAKLLGRLTMDELDDKLTNMSEHRGHMNAVQYVDELAIYTDAWYHLCRPGTYSISI